MMFGFAGSFGGSNALHRHIGHSDAILVHAVLQVVRRKQAAESARIKLDCSRSSRSKFKIMQIEHGHRRRPVAPCTFKIKQASCL